MKTVRFTVEGQGLFPFDMLRYDQCWPYSGEDVAALDYTPGTPSRRRIRLSSNSKPTMDRWASFNWHVREAET